MALDERAFFNEKPEQRPGRYTCPRCRRTNDYQIRWVRRTKKPQPPSSDADRARYNKLRDHLLRLDDEVVCKTCGKKFEVPSHHSLLFVDQLEGLPNDADLDAEIAAAEDTQTPAMDRSKLPARFTRPSKGWRG